MGERVIPLSHSYAAHGQTFSEVVLREPTLSDHFAIGDPVELHPGPDGSGRFVVEHSDRISAYLDRLVVSGKPGRECLGGLDLVDSIKIKDEIVGFFTEAHTRRARQTNSSGEPGSPQPVSSS